MTEQSKGHLAFAGQFEYFKAGTEVYRAKHADPLMTDGRRCGRWECSVSDWGRFGPMLLKAASGI